MRLGMPVFDSEYFEKVTRAAKGHGSGTGGLSKLSVAQLMEWACCKHIVKSKNVHVGSFSKDTKAYRYVAWFCLVLKMPGHSVGCFGFHHIQGFPVFDLEFRIRLRRAVEGRGFKKGGLNKAVLEKVVYWAFCHSIVEVSSLQNRKGMRRSSKQLRATLKKKLSAVLAMMQEEASGPVGQEGR